MKFKLIDIILYALLFVFVAAFPADKIPVAPIYQETILICLRLLLIGYYIYLIIRNKIRIFGIANLRNILLCIPFLLACFSNMIAFSLEGLKPINNFDTSLFICDFIFTFLVAISEEILFRLFIHNSLIKVGSFVRILGSAGIFAGMHLLNLVSVRETTQLVTVLIQVVYNFGLGLMLGFLYEYSHSLTSCIVLHFLFNLCNQILVKFFFPINFDVFFYLTAIVIAVILIVYAFLIYWFYLRKLEKYYRS